MQTTTNSTNLSLKYSQGPDHRRGPTYCRLEGILCQRSDLSKVRLSLTFEPQRGPDVTPEFAATVQNLQHRLQTDHHFTLHDLVQQAKRLGMKNDVKVRLGITSNSTQAAVVEFWKERGRGRATIQASNLQSSYDRRGHEDYRYEIQVGAQDGLLKHVELLLADIPKQGFDHFFNRTQDLLRQDARSQMSIAGDLKYYEVPLATLSAYEGRVSASGERRDELTGMRPKSSLLNEDFIQELRQLDTSALAVISVDIAGMGVANKYLGPEKVDFFLSRFGEVGRAIFGQQFCFRTGGDEFVFAVPLDDPTTDLAERLQSFYEKIRQEKTELLADVPDAERTAAREYSVKWAIDKILNDFKSQLKEQAEQEPVHGITDDAKTDELLARYLERRAGNDSRISLYPMVDAKLLYLAQKELNDGVHKPHSAFLHVYTASIVLDRVASIDDVLHALVQGDRDVQRMKAENATEQSHFTEVRIRQEVTIRHATTSSFLRSLEVLSSNRKHEKAINTATHPSERLRHDHAITIGQSYDTAFESSVCRLDRLTGIPAQRLILSIEPKPFFVLKLNKLGFSTDNKVHGSDRADAMLSNFHYSIERVIGSHLAIRNKGGEIFFLFEKAVSMAELSELKTSLDTAAYTGSRFLTARLEAVKRKSLLRESDGRALTDPLEIEVENSSMVRLEYGKTVVDPVQPMEAQSFLRQTDYAPVYRPGIDTESFAIAQVNKV